MPVPGPRTLDSGVSEEPERAVSELALDRQKSVDLRQLRWGAET